MKPIFGTVLGLKRSQWVYYGALVVLAFFAAYLVGQHFSKSSLHGDSGAFAGVAQHLLHGKILYKEVWDQKPPGIYFLFAFFEWIGHGNSQTFHFIQMFFVFILVFFLLQFYNQCYKKVGWYFVFTIPLFLFSFMHWGYYYTGFYTEEYGSYFLLFAILLLQMNKPSCRMYFLAGILSGISFLIKEPFLFLIFGFVFYILFTAELKIKSTFVFILGSALPVLLILIYLLANDAWGDYVKYLSFSVHYSAIQDEVKPGFWAGLKLFFIEWEKNVPLLRLLFWVGIGSLLDWKNNKKRWHFGAFYFALFILSALIPTLGKVQYAHYFIPMAIFGALFSIQGMFWFANRIVAILDPFIRKRYLIRLWMPLFLIFAVAVYGQESYAFLWKGKFPQPVAESSERNSLLNATHGKQSLYVDMEYFGYYYWQSGLIGSLPFPSPYAGFFDGTGGESAGYENRKRFKEAFLKSPPQIIISRKNFSAAIVSTDLLNYTSQNYQLKDSFLNCMAEMSYVWSFKTAR